MIDPNANSGQTVSFQWGTSPTLSGAILVNLAATTTSASSPYAVNTGLTSLSTGTVYYFRIKVGNVYGAILSFVTTEPVGTPTAVTNSVSGVASVTSGGSTTYNATFNGSIDPNQVLNGSGAQFEYGQDSNQSTHGCASLVSSTTGYVYVLDDTGAETAVLLNLNGAFPSDVTKNVTSLAANTWYCYRVVATWSTSSNQLSNN
jgi:phosphodiesterase/alkaline phosphatase D-like protein